MFVVRFFPKEHFAPQEEYFYHHFNDAIYHFTLFQNDNSGLYSHIDLVDLSKNNAILVSIDYT